ncbi:MAG: hypothetical protein QXN08_08850 [Nitrososphaerales archaeon]
MSATPAITPYYGKRKRSGIFKRLSKETGKPVSALKSEFMRNIAEANRYVVPAKGLPANIQGWVEGLKITVPVAYNLLKSTGRIPTPSEILAALGIGR